MDSQPQRQHDSDHDQTVAAWLTSEAFTAFMTRTFAAAVMQAMDEQTAKGVTQLW